ncbi:MAG TPA: SdpI family protein [Thermoanaerobaculaceae bacterium]|nr:SdpI family protein [Thermoanaerobaculaceae bacterium]
MIVPIPYVHAGIGVLLSVISVPLILRKVPMNHLYGVRIPKAFVSAENWYEINAYGGKLLFGFGVFLLAFAYFDRDAAPPPTSAWAPVWLVVPLAPLVLVIARITVFARRLPDR